MDWLGGGDSDVCACPASETVTKMSCKTFICQPDPQRCELAFEVWVWRGCENELLQQLSIFKLLLIGNF